MFVLLKGLAVRALLSKLATAKVLDHSKLSLCAKTNTFHLGLCDSFKNLFTILMCVFF